MTTGAATGSVRMWLRAEGLALLAAGVWWYAALGASWGTFALWFLAPDLSFVGYLAGARAGAVAYNAAHALVAPLVLVVAGMGERAELFPLAAIWIAHIGVDRVLGYGLKYPTAFGDTHLGRLEARERIDG